VQSLDADAEHALARQWLDDFALADIPKDAYEVSFVRSSGPGGQHVNKTNSKAVVHCNIHKAKWLPAFMVTELRKSVSKDGVRVGVQ
jgi:peptidyl-tRNA hydrolase ICT1